MSLAENQKRTAQNFVQGYNEWTIESLLRARSDNSVHAMLPASLGRPERTNEDYKTFFGTLSQMMSDLRNEYAFFLYFNEEGTKVVRVEELVDSAFSNGFFAKVGEYMEAKQEERPST